MRIRSWYVLAAVVGGSLLAPLPTLAHCPLCTAGIGLVAIGAYWIGVKAMTIGVVLGALATVFGLWLDTLLKKKYLPYQRELVVSASWLLTLVPLRLLFADYASWYVDWFGEYGSFFNRTYIVNVFWVGAAIGTVLILLAPALSQSFTKLRRGRPWPFQGVALSIVIIIIASLIVQLL